MSDKTLAFPLVCILLPSFFCHFKRHDLERCDWQKNDDKKVHSILLATQIDVFRQQAAEAKAAAGCRSPKRWLSNGNLIDGVERVAMQQLFLVARTQSDEVEFVDESSIKPFQTDPSRESVFGERDGFHARLLLFDFRPAVGTVIGMSECRDRIRTR